MIPVPESSRTAAQTMAEALDVPYREGFVKNRYVGRTFIMPNDEQRQASIRQKLNPIRMEFEGKRVLILDDSIVRGNTSRQIVKIARQMGAKKVYLASYSPELLHPCPYGVDMATKREFIASGKTERGTLRRDRLRPHRSTRTSTTWSARSKRCGTTSREFCKACFTGEYPTGDITEAMFADIECDRLAAR